MMSTSSELSRAAETLVSKVVVEPDGTRVAEPCDAEIARLRALLDGNLREVHQLEPRS